MTVAPATVKSRFDTVRLSEIDLNITNRCNLNCTHCAFASSIGDTNELPFDVIRQIVEDATSLGCRDIHLTGGEPTIHREFERVLELILSSDVFTRLISNGVMPPEKLRHYREMGLGHLLFSVDGLERSHDRIRGRPGLFAKTMSSVRTALDLGYHVRVNAVAMGNNLDDILALYDICAAEGVQLFSVFLYSPTGRNADRQLDLIIDPWSWRRFKRRLTEKCARSQTRVFVERGFIYSDQIAKGWQPAEGRGGGCHYLARVMDYLIITGDGNVFPCALLNDKSIPYGNVYDRSLKDIIENPSPHYLTYESFRAPAGKCGSCPAWESCHGGCRAFAYAFNGAWAHPDPQCTREPDAAPEFIPVCPLSKESLNGGAESGFSEDLSEP